MDPPRRKDPLEEGDEDKMKRRREAKDDQLRGAKRHVWDKECEGRRKPKRLLTRPTGRTLSQRDRRFDRGRWAPRDQKEKGEVKMTTPNDREKYKAAHGNGGSQRLTEDKSRKTPGRKNTNKESKTEAHYRRIQRRARRNGNQSQDK